MVRKTFKRGNGGFIQLDHSLYDSPAWQALKPGPRALYLEMRRQFNGYNNGRIFLSQRDAAKALNINRETVEKYRAELVVKGFIIKTKGHHLGVDGVGKSAHWALTEEMLNGAKPTRDFMRWKK